MEREFEAIVIGGGPAGATAAALLARAGWRVALLEAKRFPRRKVCGECVAASNLPLLAALDAEARWRGFAGPELRSVAIWRGPDRITAPLPCRSGAGEPWGRAMGREHLDALLLDCARAAGVRVFQPCRAQAIHGRPGHLSCAVELGGRDTPLTLAAPLLIGAYGSWETPPLGLGGRRPARRAGELLAFKASYGNAHLPRGLLPVLSFPGGYGGMVDSGDHTTLACCIRRETLARCRRQSREASAGEAVERYLRLECQGVEEALHEAVRLGPWLAAGPVRPAIRLRSAPTHAFLIGNAAGETHPIIGEGISMALQSAWLLCGLLVESGDALRAGPGAEARQRALQARYRGLWRAHFGARLRLAAGFAHLAMRPRLSSPLLALLRRTPQLLTLAASLSGKTRSAVGPERSAAFAPAAPVSPASLPSVSALPGAISGPHS
jgi:2-polyprenyl-6-methoxyphenol hydroxylase-like FAD-dependent oxidoreductase